MITPKISICLVAGGFFLLSVIIPIMNWADNRYSKKNARNLFPSEDKLIEYSGYLILVGLIIAIIQTVAQYLLIFGIIWAKK